MRRVIIHFMVVASCPGHGAGPSRGEQQTLCPETLWLEDVLCLHGGVGLLERALDKGRKSEVVNSYGWKRSKRNVFKPSHHRVSCILVITGGQAMAQSKRCHLQPPLSCKTSPVHGFVTDWWLGSPRARKSRLGSCPTAARTRFQKPSWSQA